jgi:hypothetical protein
MSGWSVSRAPDSCGKGLTKHLLEAGVEVVEVCRPDRSDRRRRGKSDTIDAENAAHAALSGQGSDNARVAGLPGYRHPTSLTVKRAFDQPVGLCNGTTNPTSGR